MSFNFSGGGKVAKGRRSNAAVAYRQFKSRIRAAWMHTARRRNCKIIENYGNAVGVQESASGEQGLGAASAESVWSVTRRYTRNGTQEDCSHANTSLARRSTEQLLERAKQLLEQLITKPMVNSGEVSELLGVTPSDANNLIDEFVDSGILKEQTEYRRNRIFRFEKYIKLFP